MDTKLQKLTQITAAKLGSMIVDTTTEIEGMLTVLALDMGGNRHYLFQPALLSTKTKKPVDTYWIVESRIDKLVTEVLYLPMDVLGTVVTDKATNFTGTAVQLYYHLNGCIHFEVKPKGILEDGESIKSHEFDWRRLKLSDYLDKFGY